jgi:TrmH family RNA methyltransferase
MITSVRNPRIVQVRKLSRRKYRLRQNRFLVEGLQLLGIAVDMFSRSSQTCSCLRPLELYYCEALFAGETAPRLLGDLTRAGAEAIPVAANVLNTLSERDTSQGLVAIFGLSDLECTPDELVSAIRSDLDPQATARRPGSSGMVLVLDKLQDPGNLGTLIRTADAVGVRAVFLLEPCVDPFDPKTVRSTMGSIFAVPFARVKAAVELLQQLQALGFGLIGADTGRGSIAWQSGTLSGSVALILGNEARGLSGELRPAITSYVNLPQYGHAESLNVAVAGGVLMYEWRRVNDRADKDETS